MASLKKIRSLREDEKSMLKRVFELLDTDKDGYLDYYETKAGIKALGFEIKKSQLLAIISACGNRDGNRINFENFYYIMADKLAKRNPIDEIKFAFKLFTAESPCQLISLSDLQRINKTLGCCLSEEEMEAMIEEFDTDQDSCINEAEFIEIMTNSSQ